MQKPKEYAKRFGYYVIVRDQAATIYSDTAGTKAIQFAFRNRWKALQIAVRRNAFVLCPNGITVLNPAA